ncbi:hypothetical protein F5884DRAFT_845544 [Xylogone sp. PMI_703]|nr:hypothetical protein F5884DRAFT_845544 [Xylogone sp. PMI_703]
MSLSSDEIATLLSTPALAAPPGVTPNFDHPPNRNGLAWFVTTFCMIIATFCLLLRAYDKVFLLRKMRLEEVLMVFAYGAYWATAYAGYSMIFTPGYYVHQWDLHSRDLIKPLYLILVYGCSYSAVLPLLKTAILLDWCNIFVPGDRMKSSFWWGCLFIISIQVIWGIAAIILLNMQCVPHSAIWEFYIPSKCYSLPKVMLISACVQVVSDWGMVMLPHLKKLGISVIFGVGILASISATIRLSKTITFADNPDQMYFTGPLIFWACAEMTCGFFILVINQSKLPSKIRRLMGSENTDPSKVNPYNRRRTNVLSIRKKKLKVTMDSTRDSYYKIEEESGSLQLGTLKASVSQEELRTFQGKNTMLATQKTDVAITPDSHSAKSSSDIGNQAINT